MLLLGTNNVMGVEGLTLRLSEFKDGEGKTRHVLVLEAVVGDRLAILSNYFLEDQVVEQARMLVNTWEANKTGTKSGVAVPEPVRVS